MIDEGSEEKDKNQINKTEIKVCLTYIKASENIFFWLFSCCQTSDIVSFSKLYIRKLNDSCLPQAIFITF